MKKLFLFISLLLAGSFILTGCSEPHTMDEPAQITKKGWEVEYIVVDNDNQAVPCVWNGRRTQQAVMSCDWDAKTTTIPAGAKQNHVGSEGWEIEYVEYDSRTIPCLWNGRRTKQAVLSCDFS